MAPRRRRECQFSTLRLYREPPAVKLRLKPGGPCPLPRLGEGDLGSDATIYRRRSVAKTFAAVFAPSARAGPNVKMRKLLLAPFGRPAGFAPGARVPFRFQLRLPRQSPRVAEPHPDEMKIFVQQNAAMFPGAALQFRIEHDDAPQNIGFRISLLARDIA